MFKTKREFESFFRSEVLPEIRSEHERDGQIDYPARREVWNNMSLLNLVSRWTLGDTL